MVCGLTGHLFLPLNFPRLNNNNNNNNNFFYNNKTLFTTQSEYLQINEYNAKTNRALCTKMSINFKELAYLKQNKNSLVKLST